MPPEVGHGYFLESPILLRKFEIPGLLWLVKDKDFGHGLDKVGNYLYVWYCGLFVSCVKYKPTLHKCKFFQAALA